MCLRRFEVLSVLYSVHVIYIEQSKVSSACHEKKLNDTAN